MRSIQYLSPSPPSSPPFLGPASTIREIVIEWGVSPPLELVPDSQFFYVVTYTLDRGPAGGVITGTETVCMEVF